MAVVTRAYSASLNTEYLYYYDKITGNTTHLSGKRANLSHNERIGVWLRYSYQYGGAAKRIRFNFYTDRSGTYSVALRNSISGNAYASQSYTVESGGSIMAVVEFDLYPNLYGWYVTIENNRRDYAGIELYYLNVEVEGDDTPPIITPVEPINTSFRCDESIPFSWSVSGNEYPIYRTELEYSTDSENWYRLSQSGASTSYNCPANKFPLGTLYWRVKAQTYFSDWAYSEIKTVTIKQSTPYAFADSPHNKYVKPTAQAEFSWTVTEDQYYTISRIDLRYRDSQEELNPWIDLPSVSAPLGNSTIIPANTFAASSNYYEWQCRAVNGDNFPGPWSSSKRFYTIDAVSTCTPKSPINGTSRNETEKITFQFRVTNTLGTAPKGGHAQYRVGNGNWIDLFDEPYIEEWAGTDPARQDYGYEADENTFPGAVIYWRVCAYNQDGVTGGWSSEANFSTIDKPQVSTAISPINTVEDADKPILFTWSIYSQSGEASRGADLEYSLDGNSWIAFGHKGETGQQYSLETAESFDSAEDEIVAVPIEENIQQDDIVPVVDVITIDEIENDQNRDYYTAPAGLIPPGVIFWHVRSYNRNLSPGEWSEAVSFVAKAAPVVQDLQVTAKPFATVIWQSNDQQNYEIFVDGESLGVFFGTERQYPLPDYLKDGVHTIGLRVLGSFDLWSRISETQVTIENAPTSTLTLRAPTNIDTALEWTGGSGDFFVYRNGLMIAHTNAHSFTDRTALGEHDYQVVERLASGDYNQSAVITRTPDVYCLHIAALSGGEWIAIPHRLKSESDPEYSESQEVVYNHLAGIYEPVASIGKYRDDSGKYSAVFLFNEQEEHKRFRSLRGKPVILKTADGEVVIGILHAWERKHVLNHYRYAERREMYAAYSFTIQRIGWGDYIDVP